MLCPNLASRPLPSLLLLLTAATAFAPGCAFLDLGEDPPPQVRGYTACGDFMGDNVYCAPGQYCAESTWSECDIGCLSDVNCASNQTCVIIRPLEPGYCENLRIVPRSLASDPNSAEPDAPDAGGWDDVTEVGR